MDTQWTRFEVFVQERADAPFIDAGSVHAPDAELALLNARDVFARRPQAVGMWVVPTEAIVSRTAEELEAGLPQFIDNGRAQALEQYYVGCKTRHAGSQEVVGSVVAASTQTALVAALEQFSAIHPVYVWWIFPAGRVTASRPEDSAGFYDPAVDKTFRLSTDFHTHTAMREVKRE